MILQFIPDKFMSIGAFVGILFAFLATVIATDKLCNFLPKDSRQVQTLYYTFIHEFYLFC